MSELLAIGVSHKTAPVEIRERLALTDRQAAGFLRDLRGAADVQEAVAISTCNRTELYLVASDPVEAESTALTMLSRQAGIRPTALASAIYAHRNCDAARHLYRVTSGLDTVDRIAVVPTDPNTDRPLQPVVIDSKPGAGGRIATAFVAKQPPDGHSLIMLTGGEHPMTEKNIHARIGAAVKAYQAKKAAGMAR